MKRYMMICMGLILLVAMLSGCQKVEDTLKNIRPTEQVQTEAATTEASEATAETTEATTAATEMTMPEDNDTVFQPGTWMARSGENGRYYFFGMGGISGRIVNMGDGSGANFTYVQDGNEGVLYLGSDTEGAACKVVVQDEEHVTLEWEDQPAETMTFVSSLGWDQFHFYSHDELCQMALADYRAKYAPGDQTLDAAAADNGDGSTTIQIYQNLSDHNSTAAYYWIDRCTGEGQNISNGQDVDLTKGSPDVDIYYLNGSTALPLNAPDVVVHTTEYSQKVAIQAVATVKDFRVVSLTYVENGGTCGYKAGETLWSSAVVVPTTGVVLTLEMPETMSNVGVIYQDRNGDEKLFAIAYSGLDGSALLVEETLIP